MQSRSTNNIKVIDVSHHNSVQDWSKVAASGVKGVMIKATEGKTYTDPDLQANYKGAKAAGLKVGFYHYARPENNPVVDEISNFLKVIKPFDADLPHALDVEGEASKLGASSLTTWCATWLQEISIDTGHPVTVYTGAAFARIYLGKALGKYPLWVAHYGVDTPMSNSTWDKWAMFQYTSSGSVPGIVGSVDMNELDLDYWNYLFKPVNKGDGPFNDVPESHWAASAIQSVKAAGLMNGYGDGAFKPDQPVTRAELAAVLQRMVQK